MRLTKNQLRERKIYNEYEIAELQDEPKVWVSFTPYDSRGVDISGWRVYRIGWITAGKQGAKAFLNRGREDKEEKRLEALAWAEDRYGISDWERSPFGSYHPTGTMDRARNKEA